MSYVLAVSWSTWGVLALLVALLYSVVWPRPKTALDAEQRSRWTRLILRWAHAAVWLLLATFCFVQAGWFGLSIPAASTLAWSALVLYLLFLATFFRDRVRRLAVAPRGPA